MTYRPIILSLKYLMKFSVDIYSVGLEVHAEHYTWGGRFYSCMHSARFIVRTLQSILIFCEYFLPGTQGAIEAVLFQTHTTIMLRAWRV